MYVCRYTIRTVQMSCGTYIHAYIRMYIRTYVRMYVLMSVHMYTQCHCHGQHTVHTYVRTCIDRQIMYIRTYKYSVRYVRMYMYVQLQSVYCIRTYICTHDETGSMISLASCLTPMYLRRYVCTYVCMYCMYARSLYDWTLHLISIS